MHQKLPGVMPLKMNISRCFSVALHFLQLQQHCNEFLRGVNLEVLSNISTTCLAMAQPKSWDKLHQTLQ